MDSFENIYQQIDYLNVRFPHGDSPFRIVTRLCEEAGEVAAEVNHLENMGTKQQKHGEPDKSALASEIEDVIRVALSLARYYHIEQELQLSLEKSHQKFKR